MTKTITKIGNPQGLLFDATLMDLARIKVGDQVSVTVHGGQPSLRIGSKAGGLSSGKRWFMKDET